MLETRPGGAGEKVRVLVDPDAEATLQNEGVVVVRALDPDQVAVCSDLRRSLAEPDDHGLTVDYMRPDRSVMRRIEQGTTALWNEVLPRLFAGYRPVMTTFVVKHPGAASEMFLHEDRSYVDERIHRAFTVWIPLVDVSERLGNGVLEVVPGSHRLPVGMTGSLTPDLVRPYERYLRDHLVPIDVAAGEAVIYDTRMLHASRANMTDTPRAAIVCAVVPDSADLLHVVGTGRSGRRVHSVDERFFVDHHPRQIELEMPRACPVILEYSDDRRLEPEDVAEALGTTEPPVREPVLPPDMCRGGPATPDELAVIGQVRRGPDLVISRVDAPPAMCAVDVLTGGAWSRSIRSWRRTARPPLDVVLPAIGGRHVHVDLIVLEPGARVAVQVPRRHLVRWELVVVESPGSAAGVRCGAGAANPGPGQCVAVQAGEELAMWNDGPGQLVVAVAGRLSLGGIPRRAR